MEKTIIFYLNNSIIVMFTSYNTNNLVLGYYQLNPKQLEQCTQNTDLKKITKDDTFELKQLKSVKTDGFCSNLQFF